MANKNVGPAVAVVVEDSHTAGHRFGAIAGRTFVTFEADWEPPEFEGNWGGGLLLACRRDDQDEAAEENCAVRTQGIEQTALMRADGESRGLYYREISTGQQILVSGLKSGKLKLKA